MNYRSTRNSALNVTSAHAITKGLSDEGGLYVPESIPQLSKDEILAMCDMSYADRAFEVFSRLLTDFTADEIRHCVDSAYNDKNFDSNNIAELAKLIPGTYVLELWHGPTCAFKDMALQILPYLLTTSAKKTVDGKQIAILVATSGDTGKAALEGFKDVDGTSISVFYPEDGVSKMQKRQMTTQEGKNVNVCAVKGNFDDCQNGVKAIFTDKAIADRLAKNNILLSSANSINWGRLAPQIVYYVSTYAELLKNKEIEYGEKINVVVPTGNFGNILAAYYAKLMGIPVNKLICASNSNNVLTDFINTGVYDRNRKFYTTVSPSMDILISSNLERLLYHLSGDNDAVINDWFGKLKTDGRYEISADVKTKIGELFWAGCCSDAETKAEIKSHLRITTTCSTRIPLSLSRFMRTIRRQPAMIPRPLSLPPLTPISSAAQFTKQSAALPLRTSGRTSLSLRQRPAQRCLRLLQPPRTRRSASQAPLKSRRCLKWFAAS